MLNLIAAKIINSSKEEIFKELAERENKKTNLIITSIPHHFIYDNRIEAHNCFSKEIVNLIYYQENFSNIKIISLKKKSLKINMFK